VIEKFSVALRALEICGFVRDLVEIEPGVFKGNETQGWRAVARELAAALPGQVRASASGGCAWQYGAAVLGTVIESASVAKIRRARAIVGALGANPEGKPLWSLGACARACLRFVGDRQVYDERAEDILKDHPYGYHECSPGVYTAEAETHLCAPKRNLFDEPLPYGNPDYKPPVTLYDVSSFYFDLLRRLPSLRVSPVSHGRVRFLPMLSDDRARWRDVLSAVADEKPLRNSIAGAAAGTLQKGTAYTSARPNRKIDPEGFAAWVPGTVRIIHPPGMPGPYRAAALLVVSTAAELCHMEAEYSDAVYAAVDSVALRGGATPKIWHRFGFTIEQKASGEAEICHRGSWRIGHKATEFYKKNYRHHLPSPRVEVPKVYIQQWL